MGRFEAQHLDRDLPVGGRRVDLAGAPHQLVWPRICPNCGAPATERIPVQKIFRRHSRQRGWRYVISPRVEIPFCAACAERHRAAVQPITGAELLQALIVNPLIIPVVGATTMAYITYRPAVVETRGDPNHWMGLAIFGFFALTAAWSALAAWRSTRFRRVPPQTEITRACDFSDNLGFFLSGEHRVYAIRNAIFADEFAALNHDRIWTDADQARQTWVSMVFAVLVLAALLTAALLVGT